jgi:CTP:molybdopterin cytidylyltransferase MocA
MTLPALRVPIATIALAAGASRRFARSLMAARQKSLQTYDLCAYCASVAQTYA